MSKLEELALKVVEALKVTQLMLEKRDSAMIVYDSTVSSLKDADRQLELARSELFQEMNELSGVVKVSKGISVHSDQVTRIENNTIV